MTASIRNLFPNENTTWTEFDNHSATVQHQFTQGWDEFTRRLSTAGPFPNKESCPWVKMATFSGVPSPNGSGSLRYNDAVVSISGVEGDFDAGTLAFNVAVEKLKAAGIRCFIYTSASHTPEKPRWRVLAPFNSAVKDLTVQQFKDFRALMLRRIEGVLGVRFAVESYTLSQAYFYGRIKGNDEFRAVAIDGAFIEERTDLDLTANLADMEGMERTRTSAVPDEELIAAIHSEAAYHTSLRDLAARKANAGWSREQIIEYLEAIMAGVPNHENKTKWHDRLRSIPGLVDSALRLVNKPTEAASKMADTGPTMLGIRSPNTRAAVRMVIEDMLPAAVTGITGAGGSMKSTLVLYTMVHIACGRDVFGKAVMAPGKCVFVSSEDETQTVIDRVEKIAHGLNLTDEEAGLVCENLRIVDVSGTQYRLVEADHSQNMTFTKELFELEEAYKDQGVSWIVFDPATYFGPGERYVNDGEAALMKGGRYLTKALDAAASFVHHTGKQAAKDADFNQYAGRGGSAFADNARAMWNVVKYEKGNKNVGSIPEQIVEMIDEGCDVAVLGITKMSYSRRLNDKLWFARRLDAPWCFEYAWGSTKDVENTEKNAKAERFAYIQRVLEAVCEALIKHIAEGSYPTKTWIQDTAAVLVDGKEATRANKRAAVEHGLTTGRLVIEEIPLALQQKNRTTFLNTSWRSTGVPDDLDELK